jgi:hypothetical protein
MDILSPFLAMQTQELVNPIEKAASIQAQIDAEVSKKKERDSDWEDGLDVSRRLLFTRSSINLSPDFFQAPVHVAEPQRPTTTIPPSIQY